MSLIELISKFTKLGGGLLIAIIILGLIAYVLSVAPLIIGIIFMIVLGLIGGYFGATIKLAYDRKKRETDIDKKIEKQKFHMKTEDVPRKKSKGITMDQLKESIQKEKMGSKEKKAIKKIEDVKKEIKKIKSVKKVKKATKKGKGVKK